MTDFAKDILISAAGILLTGVAGIALFNPCKRWLAERRKRKQQRADCEAQRDKTLAELKEMLHEVGGDVRCLYAIQAPQMEAIEVTLETLQGKKINGNVTEALNGIREAKKTMQARLNAKVG